MKPLVVCEHRAEIEGQIFCKKKKEFVKQPYQCSKGHCKDCKFPTVAIITIPVGRCDECPFHDTERTPRAGYAFDYFCKAVNNKKIVGYVEWDSEIPSVPTWCPFYIKEVRE